MGTWYYLIPDPSAALVSEVVDRKDLALQRTHIPGHHFTPTGPTDGHNNESDCATDDNVFLARSCDELYPKHLSLDDRVAFEIADAAEWKAIVDTGSVKVLDSEVANTIRKERPDRVINSRMVRRLKPQEGTFQKPKAKSRWCVLGHQDPDAADMFTNAPTPQTESIMMFLFSVTAVQFGAVYCGPQKMHSVSPTRWIDLLAFCLWNRVRVWVCHLDRLFNSLPQCTVSTMLLFDGIVP